MTTEVVQPTAWTPEMISALFAGMERILMALGGIILGLAGLWIQNKLARKEGRDAGIARDQQIAEIHGAVNGPVTGQLKQISSLLEEKAVASGSAVDRALADDAKVRFDDKESEKGR
jgi:outer membrane lipoprotein SlyB